MIFVSSKVSDGNMSFEYGDPKEVLKNRQRYFKKIGIKTAFEVNQTHSNIVILVDNYLKPGTSADGMITNQLGIYLMVKIADCIPIGLYDPKHQAIGLIHAGFRGLKKRIIKNTIKLMQKNFNTNPQDLEVKFGPSIGICHYRMDIWGEAEKQLLACGIFKENIDNPKICTYESKDYFSHKKAQKTNTKDARFVTILGLNKC